MDWVPPTHRVCSDGLYLLAHSPDRPQTEGRSGTPLRETFPALPWRRSLPSVDGLRTSAGACAPSLESCSCISPQLTGEHSSTGMGFLIFEHKVDTQEMFECVLMRAPECPGTRKASSVHVLLGLGRLFRMTPRGSW